MIRVTKPKGWVALLGFVGLVALALVWAVTSEIPVGVAGRGILMGGDGMHRIVTPEAGQLRDLFVSVGDPVSPGDVIGRVEPTPSSGSSVAVISPFRGRVAELSVFPGDTVERGEAIAALVPMDGDLSAVLYVPTIEGRGIRPGMEVRIAPMAVSGEDSGVMRGTVERVGDFPASLARIRRVMGEDLADQLFAGAGPSLEVRVALDGDEHSAEGGGSSSGGGGARMQGGTLVQATVIVDRTRPIQLVLPRAGL